MDIESICSEYYITDYTINADGSIDVHGNVNLSSKNLTTLPLKFKYVSGNFNCGNNQLISLEGAPDKVGGNFICDNNQLVSLKGAPDNVGGNFICNFNMLETLVGGPSRVGGDYYCGNNFLVTFEGVAESFDGVFYCYKNPIYAIWKLFNDKKQIEYFNFHDMIRTDNNNLSIILFKLNDFLETVGKPTVENVEGYANIY